MSEQDQRIMDNLERVFPTMNQGEKDRLLSFTEGMAAMAQMQQDRQGNRQDDEAAR